jgi:hypothetical protein
MNKSENKLLKVGQPHKRSHHRRREKEKNKINCNPTSILSN